MTKALVRPELTVAISLFNYANYIERAVESVCSQTMASAIELIVVDDGSSDESVNVLKRFQVDKTSLINRLASFHCELHEHNKGLAAARNTAFQLAKSPNVLVLDADNILLPQACECLKNALLNSPKSVGAVYPILAVENHPRQSIANELPWDPQRLINGNYIDALSLVRREAWSYVGGFQHTPGGWEDYDFWCRFVEHGLNAEQVPKLLGIYNHHVNSMKNTETSNRESELRQLLQRRHPWLKLTSQQTK